MSPRPFFTNTDDNYSEFRTLQADRAPPALVFNPDAPAIALLGPICARAHRLEDLLLMLSGHLQDDLGTVASIAYPLAEELVLLLDELQRRECALPSMGTLKQKPVEGQQ